MSDQFPGEHLETTGTLKPFLTVEEAQRMAAEAAIEANVDPRAQTEVQSLLVECLQEQAARLTTNANAELVLKGFDKNEASSTIDYHLDGQGSADSFGDFV